MEIFPAGEIWSVVMESPNRAKICASVMGCIFANYFYASLKNGGSWI